MTDRSRLITLLATRSTRRGRFTLASGKTSDVYIDARLTTMSPDGLRLIGAIGLAAIQTEDWRADAVGGLTLGADPIAYAISYASASSAKPLRAFTVRKQAKTHGTGQLIEGPFVPRDRVVVVEDVVTTGRSTLQAIDAVRGADGVVAGVLALVDREEGGCEAIEAAGIRVVSLVRASELLEALPT
ncbi:MAG TPA: orotate phosphoribosyltransferase [Gemmatimonadaceae bacterium]|nr:orotate phosphoribosyltransferase [Gemmatimonadaceae bacterium]